MSDRDAEHTLAELQEARAEVDRLRDLLRWRKWPEDVPDQCGLYVTTGYHFGLNYYHLTDGWQNPQVVWWKAIGPLPGGE
jgi:hypothetical protein